MSAPAGFGKTTLLTEWFSAPETDRSPTSWVSLDTGDNDPEGHIRLFLHAGPAVTALLRAVTSRADATPHAQRVLAAIDDAASPHRPDGSDESRRPPPSELIEPLSSRELDVLRLLRRDLSGPEIARELHVSMNTLRTHTKSICTKLGATSRREAIRRSAEYGL